MGRGKVGFRGDGPTAGPGEERREGWGGGRRRRKKRRRERSRRKRRRGGEGRGRLEGKEEEKGRE